MRNGTLIETVLPMCLPLDDLAGYIDQLYRENDHNLIMLLSSLKKIKMK